MKTRGFEKVARYMDVEFPMPERKTQFSAGYDISAAEEVVLEPGKLVLVPTGVKAYMQTGEFLGLHIRSSMAVKKHLMLVNNVGIIDADYYNNADNEGHIMVALM
ncbi:dUTP diphosphatase, partial [Phascolarctobacterium succinatutens]